jgi:Reverse transcriptase (RNA-dependent DNA polymerase)
LKHCVHVSFMQVLPCECGNMTTHCDGWMNRSIVSLRFSTLDANSGYWQVPVDPESRDKTTFTRHSGLFTFLRMPFGLTNTPATFQRALDIILARVKFDFALVYLDDVIVYSPTFDLHLEHLVMVLGLLKKANVSLKLHNAPLGRTKCSTWGI